MDRRGHPFNPPNDWMSYSVKKLDYLTVSVYQTENMFWVNRKIMTIFHCSLSSKQMVEWKQGLRGKRLEASSAFVRLKIEADSLWISNVMSEVNLFVSQIKWFCASDDNRSWHFVLKHNVLTSWQFTIRFSQT